jgi:crossover junction endodeoxyribonuclease RusA
MLQVYVPGKPVPQGSKNAYSRGGKIVLVEASKDLPAWRKKVADKLEAEYTGLDAMTGPLMLRLIFLLPKAKSNKTDYPIYKSDLDKLVRAIGDAATASGVIEDDGQFIHIEAMKFWAEDSPGVVIEIDKFLGVSLRN